MNAPIPNQYDAANAGRLAQCAADVYEPVSRLGALATIEDAATQTKVNLYHDDGDLIVAFRGTSQFRNWLTDGHVALVSDDGFKVHAGFFLALRSVLQPLSDDIFGAGWKWKRIWLTGHSLGGALALLYAWQYATSSQSQPFAGVYTFGQPRVGNAAFRDSWAFKAGLNSVTWRVVNAVDIVPHIPCLGGIYRHCAHEVFYGASGQATVDRSVARYFWSDVSALLSVWTSGPRSVEQWLADHHVAKYQALFSAPAANLHSPLSTLTFRP